MNPKPIRAKDARDITIEIDHRRVVCPEGVTVLRAAELNGIPIPSLCSHKDLSPFGGCRLCMVEIGGMRGYPLACSTLVQEEMQVLTETAALNGMRREILELILSEHPSSCLICSEKAECATTLDTIRKAGVSTGCRYCPNDRQCELQNLVDRLGITEIHYPILYHGYEPEHDDPFFDRDYNICILCGRCVRMCQEVRGTGILAFQHRGPRTRIGPAFGRSHVQAGCEFCGACVSVCPTGALVDKASKWDGKPDGSILSTCPFCALGCRVELQRKGGLLSKVEANLDPEINDGQLCVRGRFCLPETTHHPARARKPMLRKGRYFRETSWTETLEEAASRLKSVQPEEILMLVSPDLTNESLYTAQEFMRSVLGANGIDSSARRALPGGIGLWAELFSLPISLRDLAHADSIIAVGLDSRFSFSVAGVQIRRALRDGAKLVTIDACESNLARYTDHWLRPSPGGEGAVLRALVEGLLEGGHAEKGAGRGAHGRAVAAMAEAGIGKAELDRALEALSPGRELAVVVGPTPFALDAQGALARALLRLGERENTSFLPLYQGTNTRGALELGVLGEWHPGPHRDGGEGLRLDDMLSGKRRPRVLYLVGEVPCSIRPDCEYVIAQDLYQPPFEVDLFLPAASFAEAEGSLVNIEGRVQNLARVEDLPEGAINGFARPDWLIFNMLAEKLGSPACRYGDAAEVRAEIARRVPGFPAEADRRPRRLAVSREAPSGDAPARAWDGDGLPLVAEPDGMRLVLEPGGFRHRGIDLSAVVEGLGELRLEDGFRIHPEEMEERGLRQGEEVLVSLNGTELAGPVRADADCPRGAVYAHRPWTGADVALRDRLARSAGGLYPATITPRCGGGSGSIDPEQASQSPRDQDRSARS